MLVMGKESMLVMSKEELPPGGQKYRCSESLGMALPGVEMLGYLWVVIPPAVVLLCYLDPFHSPYNKNLNLVSKFP